MPVTLEPATVASLTEVADAVASWQQDGGPVQLHPGDLGWAQRAQAAVGVATHIGPLLVSTISGRTAYLTRRPRSSQAKV